MNARTPAEPAVAWVLFDGYCGLCDGLVRWLVRRDRRRALRYGPLQGRFATEVRVRHPWLPDADETFVLVESPGAPEERVRVRSDAALAMLVRLGGAWRFAALLRLVPRPLRDAAYRFVARRRTRWFGRLEACRVPSAAERELFLD
ncbi:MAG TPA: DCC1-like thiol-disulfide oxidoreductase family protein [Thermoanaerobaculia bacterium]|nr:DCC1-like thiol-disulfide oxidoreductase family protein [Thermoanaerobaculia bacterium]